MRYLLLSLALLSAETFAHGDRDWREDYQAYLSVSYEIPYSNTPEAKSMSASRVDMSYFKEKLAILSGAQNYGTLTIAERNKKENLDLARSFLKDEYEKLGFTVSSHVFGSGVNFIAEKLGTKTPGKVLILSSHIDSVKNRGANDNGTGTIGLLAVARELAKNEYSSTIRVLGFDKEEVGLVGSDAYATLVKSNDIIGNINFEMMGVNSRKDGAFHVIDCNRAESLFLSQEIKNSIASLGLPLSVVKTCTDRSDHASFWRNKIPAVVISENFFGGDADPCYHAKCDVMDERLNYDYMGNILEATLDATEKLIR
jgi:Zn-dependent M28 family amino/carboxypeptidase